MKTNKNYLVAVDLEGIHGIVGEPYKSLNASSDYETAAENAVNEINAICKALFDGGAEKVVVWDNHGSGKNLDFSKIDNRAERADASFDRCRMDFTDKYGFGKIYFVGYHAKEGDPRGVLAHTFSSVDIQYIKVNGVPVGEYQIDIWIAGAHGIAPAFASSDDAALEEISRIDGKTVTVKTKIAKSRNSAEFIDADKVLSDIYNGAAAAMHSETEPHTLKMPADVEVRFTRTEYAREIYEKITENKAAKVAFGDDAHILKYTVDDICILPNLLW